MSVPTAQQNLPFRSRGGKRRGAGRKPAPGASRIPHTSRPALSVHTPVHVTVKLRRGLPNLRAQVAFAAVRRLLARARATSFRVVHWSVQSDHLHLLVEADDARALSRGMASLNGRLARSVNRVAQRRGTALRERYHAHQLKTPREVYRALGYIANNGHRHRALTSGIDAMSSWADDGGRTRDARTWLLRIGWRRHGPIEMAGSGA